MNEQVLWLGDGHELELRELAELSGLPEVVLVELVTTGVLVAREAPGERLVFSARTVSIARSAARLRHDFELDVAGLAVAVRLLERVNELEADVRRLSAQIARQD
jgi:chaperone modulatory protein CbpM